MARRRASLQGRGSEILVGAQQDEHPDGADAEPGPPGTRSVDDSQDPAALAQGPERTTTGVVDDLLTVGESEPELPPEWADLLQEEASSASIGQTSMTELELALPALATTPARPNRPTSETPEAAPQTDVSGPEPAAEPVDAAEISEAVEGGAEMDSESHAAPVVQEAPEEAAGGEHEVQISTYVSSSKPEPYSAPQGSMPSAAAPASTAFEDLTPPAPYGESQGFAPAGGAYVPAPKEKPEATDTVMRAKLDGLLYQHATVKPSGADLEPDGPDAPEMVIEEIEDYEAEQPSRTRREPEILAYVGTAQRTALWEEALELYRAVPDVLTGDANQGRALRLLQEAQDILLEKPRQFDVARFKVSQVQALVSWRRNVNRWSNTYGWGIFAYEILWIVALVLGIFGAERVVGQITNMAGGAPGIDGLLRLWTTMMWCGLGGVIGAYYSLYWHVAKVRDFDKQYTMWYIVQPVIGLLLGGVVYLVIGSGFLTAQGVNQENQTVSVSLFPYAVACIAGFRQRFILEMIDRVIQVITPSTQPKQAEIEDTITEEPLGSTK